MKRFSQILRLQEVLDGRSYGQIGNAAGVRIALRFVVLAFLGVNLWYRFWTISDYSRFVGGLFIFLGLCSLVVILFPKFLRAFLFLFGASFFLFGFRGYDIQSQVFETVVVFVALTVFFVNLRRGEDRDRRSEDGGQGEDRDRRSEDGGQGEDTPVEHPGREPGSTGQGGRLNGQLVGLMLCYVGLSVLSLQLLPLGHIVKDFWLFGLKSSFLQVANATPNTYLYPLAGINRLILFSLFALEVSRKKEARELFKWIFVGIFTGGVFCAFVGLLDYYGIISLAWYRLGTVTTPGALHSTFLNRGWFAEFILTVVPFVLIGFMSKIEGLWWKILLLCSLVVCEIALILAGARAGWVSYPLILFFCWLFFYFSKGGRLESFHFKWWDLVKVGISVPITIVISFLFIFQVLMPLSDKLKEKANVKGISSGSTATSQFIEERASSLAEASGRVPAWMQGVDVARERRSFGMGYESFCWHANILLSVPKSYYTIYIEKKFKEVLDTPHNTFIQLFVSGGVVGVCLWVLIIGYVVMILVVDLIKNKRLLNMPVIISIISFHIYGIFQSMQYIPMVWMFIFLNLGYAMTLDEKVLPERLRRITGFVVKVMILFVLIGGVVYFAGRGSQGLADKYGLQVYATDQDWHKYLGFYHREKWPTGYYRWSGPRARVVISGQGSVVSGQKEKDDKRDGWMNGGVVEFDFVCSTPGVEEKPVTLTVSLDGERIDEVCFVRKGAVKRQYYFGKKMNGGDHKVLFEVSRTWNPKKMGISADVRDLGVAVSEPRVLEKMPKDGIGFYHWEMLDAQSAEHMAQSGVGRERRTEDGGQRTEDRRTEDRRTERFRWTGRRASLPIAECGLGEARSRERRAGSAGGRERQWSEVRGRPPARRGLRPGGRAEGGYRRAGETRGKGKGFVFEVCTSGD